METTEAGGRRVPHREPESAPPTSAGDAGSSPFSLLSRLYADRVIDELFSERAAVSSWLAVEAALARAQARLGIIPSADGETIAAACDVDGIDLDRLWQESVNVGYPILPLVRQVAGRLPDGPDGRVHLGATTQDIMDSGLALQLSGAIDRLEHLNAELGDALERLIELHRDTIMAARTHGQQAVPTTLGSKLAVHLEEAGRHRDRLGEVRTRACRLSMFGAGGTSAAYGEQILELRQLVAADLGLAVADVSWHVSRDALAEFAFVCAAMAESCARLAREVIDLSRTEIGELREADGHHRGASSTMPQKANPISSEGIVGLAIVAGGLGAAMLRTMEAGHERAAGEWQAEWEILPRSAALSAAAMRTTAEMLRDLRVDADAMQRNLDADGGAIMAEAYMMRLAPELGRERAHDAVYAAVREARASGRSLADALRSASPDVAAALGPHGSLRAADYLGDAAIMCDAAVTRWRARPGRQSS